MKILNVNKYFYHKAGAETYYFELNDLLESHGHKVIHFSMKDPHNLASPYEKYFVSNINYETQTKFYQKVRNALKIIYSFEASRKLKRLLQAEQPDLVHIQNFHHQLSPSILRVIEKFGIPVVYTAHDLKLVCPNYKMLADGQICERCKQGTYSSCVKLKCVKDSRISSFVNMIEMTLAKKMNIIRKIDTIIVPSLFYKQKLSEWGIDERKLVYIPNFIDCSKDTTDSTHKNYFIYFGRLAEEKGIMTLLKAMEHVKKAELYILGSGPLQEVIQKEIKSNSQLSSKVQLLGFKSGEELHTLLRQSMFNVLPSEWYENGPYSVLEMMCIGKPTIAANIGGLPDMIQDRKTGLLFKSGDSQDLARKINELLEDEELLQQLGENCRQCVLQRHSQDAYYRRLMKVYKVVLRKKGRKDERK